MKNKFQFQCVIWVFICLLLSPVFNIYANSSYSIGHDQISLIDTTRDNRTVTAELYYPSLTQGEQVEAASGSFPLIVFAHGYQEDYSGYHLFWQYLVARGYIVLMITTESGLTINTDTYAQDINYLLNDFLRGYSYTNSIVAGHLSGKSALMGHSTGGGASYIAQSLNAQADTIISMAALANNYGLISGSSAIEKASSISTSSLVLAGKQDCICPVDTHQQPLYTQLFSTTKAMVSFTQGDHCGFTDSLTCPAAELVSCGLSGQQQTMSDSEQTALSLDYIIEWLDYYLKADTEAWTRFKALMQGDEQKQLSFQDGEVILQAPNHLSQVDGLVVNLSWSAIANAQGYQLFYAPHPFQGEDTIGQVDLGTALSVSITLWPGASFYTAVKAYNQSGESGFSNIELFSIDSL